MANYALLRLFGRNGRVGLAPFAGFAADDSLWTVNVRPDQPAAFCS